MKDRSAEVEPLSSVERAWIRKLEKHLLACPPRLGLYTIGDASLNVYDIEVGKKYNIYVNDNGANSSGVYLCRVSSAVEIEGVSG